MGNHVSRAVSFLAILVAVSVGGAGIALSQTLSLDDRSATAVGDSVTFTLSLNNPSGGEEIQSLTADLCYDPDVLTYGSNTRGSLVEGWQLFGVNDTEEEDECEGDVRVLKIAGLTGFDPADFSPIPGIPAGTPKGAIVELHFTVASENNDTLMITSLDGFDTEDGEFTFELPPANNPPEVRPDMGETEAGQSVVIDVLNNDHDPNGEQLTIRAVTQGDHGAVTITNNGATVTYTPEAGHIGDDEFTYTVSNGTTEVTATVMVTVTSPPPPTNNDPMATDDEAETDEGESVMIDVLDNDSDPDGDTLTIYSVTPGNNGTVTVADDAMSVTYAPNTDFAGEDEFMYTVSDGEGGMDTATVMVDVMEVDDPGSGDGDGDMDGEKDGDTRRSGGGGGCTLNPGAPFDPTLLSVLALFMGVYFVRGFARRQSLR